MIWTRFDEQYPPQDGQARLIVWYKGPERERHLGVAWRDVELFKQEHNITEADELTYWVVLTDPEDQNV